MSQMNNSKHLLEQEIELSDEKIYVYLLQLSLFDYSELFCYLSEDERIRADRLKIDEKKKQFVITRGALKKLLSNSLDKPGENIEISYGEYKKPFIKEKINNKTVEFNVSHSGDYALIAITLKNKVGIDIEKINYDIDYSSLSNRFFSQQENKELLNIDKSKQLEVFYRVWARKESFIKAIGKGVAFGLDNFSVSIDEVNNTQIKIHSSNLSNEYWYCYDLMEPDNYKTALTSCNRGIDIISFQSV
jgi:4'-phosphopantetheinyl transferase